MPPTGRALLPLGWGFHGLSILRAALYRKGVARSVALPAPCASVGNLTFGGTGKTPFTAYLSMRALSLGFHPCVLLRGYGRRSRGPVFVTPGSSWEEVGDEALVLARSLPGIPVVACEHRDIGARLSPPGTDLFVIDDGFQHLRVRRDLDVVLVDAGRVQDLAPPPLGRLREPLSALGRAHLLALTRGRLADLPLSVALEWSGRPRVALRFEWEDSPFPPEGDRWGDLGGVPCAAFAGIAQPAAFFGEAAARGLDVREALPFPDHAAPTPARVAAVKRAALRCGARLILCTEKDYVKWSPALDGIAPLRHPRQRVVLEDPEGVLDRLLLELAGQRIGQGP